MTVFVTKHEVVMMLGCSVLFVYASLSMDFDEQGLNTYKSSLAEIAQAAHMITDPHNNDAARLCLAEAQRVSTLENPQQIFDETTYERIEKLTTCVQAQKEYQSSLQGFIDSIVDKSYNQKSTLIFRNTSTQLAITYLQQHGICFAADSPNTLSGRVEFLQANKSMSPEAQQHLIPGLFFLHCAQFIQRKTARATTAEQKKERNGHEKKPI